MNQNQNGENTIQYNSEKILQHKFEKSENKSIKDKKRTEQQQI